MRPDFLRAVYIDFESANPVKNLLDDCGAAVYWEHPETRATCGVFVWEQDGRDIVLLWVPREAEARLVRDPRDLIPTHCWEYLSDDAEVRLAWGAECPIELALAVEEGRSFVAHNVAFDARAWRWLGWPEPREWHDTMPATYAQLGVGGLDDALRRAGYPVGKLPREKAWFTARSLSPAAVVRPPQYDPSRECEVGGLLAYCAADAIPTAALGVELLPLQPAIEIRAAYLDLAQQDRGLRIDLDLAERLRGVFDVLREDQVNEVESLTQGGVTAEVLRSPAKLNAWLEEAGLTITETTKGGAASLAGKLLERITTREPDEVVTRDDGLIWMAGDGWVYRGLREQWPIVVAVLQARLGTANIGAAKIEAAQRWASRHDGRVRDQTQYGGASTTGRDAGRAMQPQNFPGGALDGEGQAAALAIVRSADDPRTKVERLRELSAAKGVSLQGVVKALLRPLVIPDRGHLLAAADAAQIEARILAVMAGQDDLVQAFAEDRDVYAEFAGRWLYPGQDCGKTNHESKQRRTVGKVTILGSGYQMGYDRFAAQVVQDQLDLQGLTPADVIDAYRDAYPMIAGQRVGEFVDEHGVERVVRSGGLWKAAHAAGLHVARTGETSTFGVGLTYELHRSGDDVILLLPSGREIVYPHSRIEMIEPRWGGAPRETWVYDRRNGAESMYGGKLVENADQATARDHMIEAFVAVEERYGCNVLRIHDELMAEPVEELAVEVLGAMAEALATPPAWAPHLPLKAEGELMHYWTKTPLPDWHQVVRHSKETQHA